MVGKSPQTKEIKAYVLGGRGIASDARSTEIAEISEKFGIPLIDGSLNLIGNSPVWLDSRTAIYTNGDGHYYWNGYLNDMPVIVNRWTGSCPAHVYEIFAEEHLRTKFNLSDGDVVKLEISREIINKKRNSSRLNQFIWYLTWWGREKLTYRGSKYNKFIYRKFIHKFLGRANQR